MMTPEQIIARQKKADEEYAEKWRKKTRRSNIIFYGMITFQAVIYALLLFLACNGK